MLERLTILSVALVLSSMTSLSAQSAKPDGRFTVLHSFTGTDGDAPTGPLMFGRDGMLYGATSNGGVTYKDNDASGFGAIFKLSTDGKQFQSIYSCALAGDDSICHPTGVLVMPDGSVLAGSSNAASRILNIAPSIGKPRVLLSFPTLMQCISPLALGPDGRVYGTTLYGGTNNSGIVFCVDASGKNFQELFSVKSGDQPALSPVLFDHDGVGYFATTGNAGEGYSGSVYKIHTDHTVDPIDAPDAAAFGPEEIALGMYGTLYVSGTHTPIFAMDPDGKKVRLLHTFQGKDGYIPRALVVGKDHMLYGSTQYGGPEFVKWYQHLAGYGTIFRIAPDGTQFETVHSFSGKDGENPNPLVAGPDGSLYGSTVSGGANNHGTVFKFLTICTRARIAGAKSTDNVVKGKATVALLGSDMLGAAHILRTMYRIDGGRDLTYSAPIPISKSGRHKLVFWSVNKSGDTEPENELMITIQ